MTIESFHPAADNPLAMRKLILVLCVTLLGSSVACRKAIRKVAGHGSAHGSGDPASPAKLLAEASSLYAQGFNKLIGPMKGTIDDYEREVPDGFKGAPARKPGLTLGTADRDLEEAAKLFAQAKEITPAAQADMGQAAEAMLAAARALRKDFAEAVRYYNAENYKDDKGEGAKAIASRMRISIEVYESRARKLQDRLGGIELEAMERELKELPATVPGYHFRAVNLAAKRLVEARAQVEKVVPALEAVKRANANLKRFAETRTDLIVTFKNYIGLVDQFESQAIAFARDLREPNRDPKSLQRNTTLLVARYNNLVQMGNSLYQFEDQGLLK